MSFAQRSAALISQPEPVKKRRKSLVKIKPSMVAIYASVFALVVAIISIGYIQPKDSTTVANAANVSVSSTNETSVDNAVATNVAAGIAQTSNLPVASSVSNLAVTTQLQSQLSQSDGSSASKPQIIESVVENRKVTSYTVVSGDTVNSLATKFGISAQTIKWANNLTTDALSVGSTIKVLPVNGILYSVKDDDTIDSIVKKYSVDKTRLVTYNDLEVSGIQSNTSIILPDGILPEAERPGYIAPITSYSYYYYHYAAGYASSELTVINNPDISNYVPAFIPGINIYSNITSAGYNGQCTWYAYQRRAALGIPIPNRSLGDAGSWAWNLQNLGYRVTYSPAASQINQSFVGAIIQNGGGAGHVGIVESVYSDGSILISEMNNASAGGNYVVDTRVIPAYAVSFFNYIH